MDERVPRVADTNPVGGIIATLNSFLGAVKVAAYIPKTRTASRRARAHPQPESTAGCSVHFCFKYFMGPFAPEASEETHAVSLSAAWTSFQSRTRLLPLKSE